MSVTAPVSTRLDLQRGVMQNEKRRKRAIWPAEQVEQYDTYPAGHPYSWSTIGSMEDLNGRRVRRCSDNERVMSTCSRAYPPHAHIAHSIEWLYWGYVRIPSLKLRPPLIVLIRKVTSPGAVSFAGFVGGTTLMTVCFLTLS